MYKMLNMGQYPTLRSAIEFRQSTHRYPTSRADSYVVPFPRTEGVRGNFQHQFIVIWNDIPEGIKELGSFRLFKKQGFLAPHVSTDFALVNNREHQAIM